MAQLSDRRRRASALYYAFSRKEMGGHAAAQAATQQRGVRALAVHGLGPHHPRGLLVKEQEAKRQESTVNAILSAVAAFYEFHERVGDVEQPGSLYRLQVMPRQRYKSFLYHIAKSKPVLSKMVKLKEPRRLPQTLKPDQVKQLIDACQRYRDKLLITSTFAP